MHRSGEAREPRVCQRAIAIVIEGRDGAGKTTLADWLALRTGGVVVRPPHVAVDENAQRFLHSFDALLPRSGEVIVFDRSWYTAVTVQRVMGFRDAASVEACLQAIPDYERAIVGRDVELHKLLVVVDRAEQRRRLAARPTLTLVDRAAPRLWPQYALAEHAMVSRTGEIPWLVIDGNRPPHEHQELERILAAINDPNKA